MVIIKIVLKNMLLYLLIGLIFAIDRGYMHVGLITFLISCGIIFVGTHKRGLIFNYPQFIAVT